MAQPALRRHHCLTLRHGQAPWLGQWVIGTDLGGTFWALRDRDRRVRASHLVERYSFGQCLDASRFLRHLLLGGWRMAVCAEAVADEG